MGGGFVSARRARHSSLSLSLSLDGPRFISGIGGLTVTSHRALLSSCTFARPPKSRPISTYNRPLPPFVFLSPAALFRSVRSSCFGKRNGLHQRAATS